jgi:hypothetical protein
MMTKLQATHGAAHKRAVKCSATVARIVLHDVSNNNKKTTPPSPATKDFHHQKGVSS